MFLVSDEKPWRLLLLVSLIIGGRCGIGRIGRGVVEAHVLPELESGAQRTAPLRGFLQHLRPRIEANSPLLSPLTHRFRANPARSACSAETPWIPNGTS